ncbi:Deoxyguanosinetriphosphate triphosphohydrolase-like protein [Meiothermus luteus]|jgi:dGTPase|uniref:Deoxyguanosinetriphosphate triphosphohydrolase-like protein n=1 Tax=Meiothermus luteus TaxID=2026184 RepID=A0A399EWN9_9DEIN|nr:deoxyguanosinetriphosphate triphosphohydrolase [Meiothermus luteus]RIH88045.1 Deoxyguanosinetriphosphate triphosphohydrolase-like protein [Meiothermus luteus]RMH56829.1 MAG: deoxyguanosinetriphosphate triphosphohydrolase [Deinococcota bacterium]
MLFDRLRLEALEEQILAPYAVRSSQTRGRAYPEPESAYRTPFQKDRDRVNHTTAFRRLQYKTQVFVNFEGDYYRTRLTHTLEVAQVARSIARALGLNLELAETIAFAHDLGHPPFGHAGEAVLNELMQGHGGFDHNKQSLRIVTYLEERYPGFRGLNLCWESREGIIKHETRYDLPDAQGYEPHLRPSLEAQIVNLADEIAYNAHDLDDGLRSGLLQPGQLLEVELLKDLLKELGLRPEGFDELGRRTLVRELLGLLITDTIQATHRLLVENRIESLQAVRQHNGPLAGYSSGLTRQLQDLREFLYTHFYRHYYVVRQVSKSRFVLERLFEAYTHDPKVLPPQVQRAAESEGIHRAACDYIAGMTDRFALDEYARLFEPEFHR